MPSKTTKKDIISKAVEQVLNSDETIDLLLISQSLDDINGEVVGTDPDYGMHYNYLFIGMSGQQMVDQMNSNFHATDAQFLAHNNALQLRIISNQVKEIKEDNGILYYTTEEKSSEEEEDTRTWTPLQAEWGKITGTITNQKDLQDALASKAPLEDFNKLSQTVTTNSNSILILQGNITSLSNSITSISNQINNSTNGILVRLSDAEATLAKKITSEDVIEIRAVNGTALEFTLDGEKWLPVSDAGLVEWGNITGDIKNQADINLLFNNMNELIETLQTTVTNHTTDVSNPHEVTAEQIGLGNVDNTSDDEKPLSTPQQTAVQTMIDEAIAEALSNDSKFVSLTKAEYDALETKDNTTFYFINDD